MNNDYVRIYFKDNDDKIYLKSDLYLENINIQITINNNIIYSNYVYFIHDNLEYWFWPENSSYLNNEFIFNIYKNDDLILSIKINNHLLKNKNANDFDKISIFILSNNNPDEIINCFINILDDERISDILIFDSSEQNNYNLLLNNIEKLINDEKYKKIKVHQNTSNSNIEYILSLCNNDWIIILDSYDILTVDYINKLYDISLWNTNTIYKSLFNYNFDDFQNTNFNKQNISQLSFDYNVVMYFNEFNYFVNKNNFLRIYDQFNNYNNYSHFANLYFIYLWLKNDNELILFNGIDFQYKKSNTGYDDNELKQIIILFENINTINDENDYIHGEKIDNPNINIKINLEEKILISSNVHLDNLDFSIIYEKSTIYFKHIDHLLPNIEYWHLPEDRRCLNKNSYIEILENNNLIYRQKVPQIWKLFRNNKRNTIVQIGANEGYDSLSNLVLPDDFLLLVEPMEIFNDSLKECYKNVNDLHIENIVITTDDKKSETTFYTHEDMFDPNRKSIFAEASLLKTHVLKYFNDENKIIENNINCLTINKLFDKYKLTHIDILFLDIEGIDDIVIKSINFNKYRIDKIIYEHGHINSQELNLFLKEKGYQITKNILLYELNHMAVLQKINGVFYRDLGKPGHGQIGNQFFEISATIGLALDNNVKAFFPDWKYNKYLKNKIETDDINKFNIKNYYRANHFEYKKIPYSDGLNLHGYFQSEKYFKNHESYIRNIFKLEDDFEKKLKNKWNYLLKTNTVSIHVRRGDYLNNPTFHIILPMSYYKKSLKYIDYKDYPNKIDNVLIFSDDIQWCKENFMDNDYRYNFIENQIDIEDLFLMSFCNHNIIANSSFSWWGSWLNKNENKIVCAPYKWFGDEWNMKYSDIYYDKCEKINY